MIYRTPSFIVFFGYQPNRPSSEVLLLAINHPQEVGKSWRTVLNDFGPFDPPFAPRPATNQTNAEPANPVDRRRSQRRSGKSTAVLITDFSENESDSPIPAWVLNRSDGGLALLSPAAIPPGTTFKVRPSAARETVGWTDLEVRGCRALARTWLLHCQFVFLTPEKARLLFG